MRTLFEMPFTFSSLIVRNEGFQKALLEICGENYERPKVAVIRKYVREYKVMGTDELVDFVFDNGEIHCAFLHEIVNIPSDMEIAKNKKLYEFWKSTMEQLNKKEVTNA